MSDDYEDRFAGKRIMLIPDEIGYRMAAIVEQTRTPRNNTKRFVAVRALPLVDTWVVFDRELRHVADGLYFVKWMAVAAAALSNRDIKRGDDPYELNLWDRSWINPHVMWRKAIAKEGIRA